MISRGRKFGNRKTEIDGITFDSKKEARRFAELRLLERTGEISNLQIQVPYELIPTQRDEKTGKVIERAVTYKADFVYNRRDGSLVVEDTKGVRTDVYMIKRKLMLWVHGIRVEET